MLDLGIARWVGRGTGIVRRPEIIVLMANKSTVLHPHRDREKLAG
jgi:hypothetical protein